MVRHGATGFMEEDLATAFFQALELDGDACIEFALDHSWERSTDRFLAAQAPIDWGSSSPEASETVVETGAR